MSYRFSYINGDVENPQITTPSNPDSTFFKLYFKSDGYIYRLNSAGSESKISLDADVVHLAGEESITGLKHFNTALPQSTQTPTAGAELTTKTYVDGIISAANALVYKGVIDCSGNPNYPAASVGWLYVVSVAGKIGGASGITVDVGDLILCNTANAGGTQAAVGADFNIVEKNIIGAVSGPASATDGDIVLFDQSTGKIIKDSGKTIVTSITDSANVPTDAAVKAYVDTAVSTAAGDGKVKVSAGDPTSEYLGTTILGTTDRIDVSIVSPTGSNEKVQIDIGTKVVTTDGAQTLTNKTLSGEKYKVTRVEAAISPYALLSTDSAIEIYYAAGNVEIDIPDPSLTQNQGRRLSFVLESMASGRVATIITAGADGFMGNSSNISGSTYTFPSTTSVSSNLTNSLVLISVDVGGGVWDWSVETENTYTITEKVIYPPLISTSSATYTVLSTDEIILADATSNAITVDLPAAATSNKRRLTIKKVDSSANAVTLDGNASETIDGKTTEDIVYQWDSLTIVCDGTSWFVV